MKKGGKKAGKRIFALGLTILLCLLQIYMPAEAQEEDNTSDGAKTICVQFDTTYGEGFYLGESGWLSAQGSYNITVEPDMDFSLHIKTEGDFVAGYTWNTETIMGNLTGENVIAREWEDITENSTLHIFFDQKLPEENFNITFSETQGHYGSNTIATLQTTMSNEMNLDGIEIKWGSSYGNGFVTGSISTEAGILSRCNYTVKCNENSIVYATAGLYRRGTLLAEVVSEAFYVQKDDKAPVVTEVLYSVNGEEFQALEEGQKIWGSQNITFRASVVDPEDNCSACGVSQVNILLNNSPQSMSYNAGSGYYEYTVERKSGQAYSFTIKVDACDYVGNQVLEEPYSEFGLDNKGPEVLITLKAGERKIQDWYSEIQNDEPLQMAIIATDDSTVVKVEIASSKSFAEGTVLCSEVPWLQGDKYIFTTSGELFTGEQNRTYYIRAYDEFGNVGEVVEQKICIDNTKPERQVVVAFTGTEDMLVQVSGGDASGQSYVVEAGEGMVYDNEKIAVKLMVKDTVIAGKEQCVSGIGAVDFTVLITDESGTTTQSYHVEENAFGVDDMGRMYVYYETELRGSTGNYEAIFQLTEIVITDNAGNKCPIDVQEEPINDSVYYAVDNQAPDIVYEYTTNTTNSSQRVEAEGEEIYYYAQPFVGTVVISDMNLNPDSVKVESASDYDVAKIGEVDIEQQEDFEGPVRISYTLPGDGRYRILTQADDILENAMSTDGIKTVCSQIMIVDSKKPEISISLTGADGGVYSEYAGICFSSDMVANILIEDKNLDVETLSMIITGKTADGSSYYEEVEATSWIKVGEGYAIQYSFVQEGSYAFNISCVDMAGNKAEITGSSFCIDKTAPVVNVEFIRETASNGMYYNTDKSAVITVRDYTFFVEGTNFVVDATNGTQVNVGEWVHHGAENCDGITHTINCTYTCETMFSTDDIYTFSFSCLDRAGHSTEEYQSGTFVVDKTVPSVNIFYDAGEPKNGYYFNVAHTAYITIEDLTFSSELVSVEVIEGKNVDALPSLGNFRSENGKYVLPITFEEDGIYQFVVKVSDLAGNTAPIQQSEYFIVDTTAPELEFVGVVAMSANNGAVQPVMTYEDSYLDDTKTWITLEGKENGSSVVQYTKTAEGNGYKIVCDDFEYASSMDDWYTLSMHVEDYAGNVSEEAITFSVNRFGSVYMLDSLTEQVIKRYYNSEVPDIKITEINVDELKDIKITCSHNGEICTLVTEQDYVIEKEGEQGGRSAYSYIINSEHFAEDGYYVITLSSIDTAGNKSDNRIKGTEIAFVVDRTAPSVVLAGLESAGVYRKETQRVTIDVQDNVMLKELQIYLGENIIQIYDKEMLERNNGIVTCEIGEMQNPETVVVVATDEAGNTSELVYDNIIVSTDIWVIREAEVALGNWNGETAQKRNILLGIAVIGGVALLSICIAKIINRKEDAQ